ncbi:MAG TPA: 3-oxoadipate enol-lactonase [Solirubrobacteraceae bacterium]|nr:3-oxoadipate enol-lactonase [Solirubrobacteraceae bacterium]
MSTVALHHVQDGPRDAPLLVLGPSLGANVSMWSSQAAALSDAFRVVRYDHRGHGGSPAPPGPYEIADLGRDVLGLLDALGAGRVHLGGLSLGGMVAMWVAIHAPERVDRIVLCCTSARLGPPEMWRDRARRVRGEGLAAVAPPVVERWISPAGHAADPERTRRLEAMLAANDPEGYASCCGAIERMDLTGELAAIRAPALVIGAAGDLATPPAEHAARIAAAIPGARLEVLEGAAHMANLERPDAVTELMREHLR